MWVACLEMANGDPLRAKEIYEDIDGEWFAYWQAWQSAKVKREIRK